MASYHTEMAEVNIQYLKMDWASMLCVGGGTSLSRQYWGLLGAIVTTKISPDFQYFLILLLQYDGDTEHSQPHPPGERGEVPFNLRATVDGDARRGRRYSSDESAVGDQSVTEMDQTEYLKGYQSSTPMQPGNNLLVL